MKKMIAFLCLSLMMMSFSNKASAGDILYYSIGKKVTTASSTSTASNTPSTITNNTWSSTASDTPPSVGPPPHKEFAKNNPEANTASKSEATSFDAIHAATESALDMLIKAKAKYKAKEISQEDYLKVADRVADYAAIERQRDAP